MFQPDSSIDFVRVTRDQVVAIVESINQPQISIPGKAAQAVQGHLCSLRNPNGSLSIYISLYLPQSAENVVYVHEPRELAIEEYRSAEVQGLHFLESMGFMLDNLRFRNLSPELQERSLERVPLFCPPQSRPKSAASAHAQSESTLARLLMSF
ncbi:MAG TPA: hypothetical protein VMK12_05755 [Anaeromyxobacteraceae bacterium]|nr:hypothetical protein [Anaeromyxobacteraceae bacterium]